MFHVRINEVAIDLKIDLSDPMLIKEDKPQGDENQDAHNGQHNPKVMCFVRTKPYGFGDDKEGMYYIPGASLRGVLHTAAEKRARLFSAQDIPNAVCDLFDKDGENANCGERIISMKPALNNCQVYAHSCAICRCFGHVKLKGRWGVSDAFPARWDKWHSNPELQQANKYKGQERTRNAVSRKTGSAQDGKLFRQEILPQGSFYTRITLVNYELWQLGLFAYLLHDLNTGNMGRIRIGSGTHRGHGRVEVAVENIEWRFYQGAPTVDTQGVVITPMAKQAGLEGYDFQDANSTLHIGLDQKGQAPKLEQLGKFSIYSTKIVDPTSLDGLWAEAAPLWREAMRKWPSRESSPVVDGDTSESGNQATTPVEAVREGGI